MDDIERAKQIIEEKFACVQTAPSMKTALGEPFGIPLGNFVHGRLVTALRLLGFKRVFETDFGAELRVMEESTELKERMDRGENLPLLTSCCPSWVGICVKKYPDLIPYLSTCKSPMEMVSSLAKSYLTYEKKLGDIGIVAIMPCYAKKMETVRGETDVSLTAMELVKWMREEGIQLEKLPFGVYDAPLGMASSAGTIYASSGGVAEATMRTFTQRYCGGCVIEHFYNEKTKLEGMREVVFRFADYEIKIGMVEGIKAIDEFCQGLLAGKYKDFDLVEMMFCRGGCVGGNGMPNAGNEEYIRSRIKALRKYDDCAVIKSAHENPLIKEVYDQYLGQPFGKRAREILHHKDFKKIFGN